MCFSATASFTTAALTGAIGILTLTRHRRPQELSLALVPLIFSAQQALEGVLWLALPATPAGADPAALVSLYLFFAQVFWPVYAPLAIALAEPDPRRRRPMSALLAVGFAVAAFLSWGLATHPHAATIIDGHIAYVTEVPHLPLVALAYGAATCLPMLLSSERAIVAMGAVVLVGSGLAYLLYWEAFQSVWCFFAAAASALLLFHFQALQARRRALP